MKLLVSDFDGTVYRNSRVTSEDLNGIKKWRKNGNIFAIATGRKSIEIVRKTLDGYMDYLICENGAKIYDSDNKLLFEKSANIKILDGIKKLLRNYEYLSEDCSKSESRFSQYTVWFKNANDSCEFAQKVEKKFGNVVAVCNNRGECGVDIVPFGVGKTEAIYKLLELLKLDKASVITVGDGLNDIAMLKEFDGYIVESADEDIKKMIYKRCKNICEII